jgi:hypothetical protein
VAMQSLSRKLGFEVCFDRSEELVHTMLTLHPVQDA